MTRKVIALIFVLLAGLAVLFYFISQSSRNILTDPYKLVPANACFFVESSDFPGLLNSVSENNGMFREILTLKGMEKSALKFNHLRNFFNRNEISVITENSKTVLSFHFTGSGGIAPLLVMTLPENFRLRHIAEAVKKYTDSQINIIKKGINKILVLQWPGTATADTLYIGYVSGLAVCTTSSEIMDMVINRGNQENDIRAAPGISRLISSSGKNEDKIFIVFRNSGSLISRLTGGKAPWLADVIMKLAGSAEGDIVISENGCLLTGYTECTDSSDILYKYKSHGAGTLSTYRMLPVSTIMFRTMIISGETRKQIIEKKEEDTIYKLANELLPSLDDELTTAVIDLKKEGSGNGTITVYSLKNRDMAERIIYKKFNDWCRDNKIAEKNVVRYFHPDDMTKISVISTPFKGLSSVFYGNGLKSVSDSLYAFNENYMISADSYEGIEKFLYGNLLNKTIITNADFRDFEATLPSKASYFFCLVPSASIDFMAKYFNDSIIGTLKGSMDVIKKIRYAGYQFIPGNGMIYNTLSVRYVENIEDETGTEWETRLDGAVVTKPFFFVNHNTGAKEIVVQDEWNNLYLINAAGRILWKIQTGERIIGNIYIIDFYGNGKYQILFAGKNNLYLVDRNGNFVERYPVKLRSPASGPPALFDYDNNRNYRIFIPGEDKVIYVYDKYGNVVKGWKPFKTNGYVRSEIKFFRLSGKDFILAADENSVYFLDRTGNVRMKTSEPVTCAAGSEIKLNHGVETSFVFTSPDGTVNFVTADGNVQKVSMNRFSFNHSFDFFDIDGDGYGEFIFIDQGKLYLYDHDRTEVFVRDFGSENILGQMDFIFSQTERKIGIFDALKKQIFLIDKKGNDMQGFPLKGFSKFSIGKLSDKGGFHLIVGGNDNFLYNYKLNTEGNND